MRHLASRLSSWTIRAFLGRRIGPTPLTYFKDEDSFQLFRPKRGHCVHIPIASSRPIDKWPTFECFARQSTPSNWTAPIRSGDACETQLGKILIKVMIDSSNLPSASGSKGEQWAFDLEQLPVEPTPKPTLRVMAAWLMNQHPGIPSIDHYGSPYFVDHFTRSARLSHAWE